MILLPLTIVCSGKKRGLPSEIILSRGKTVSWDTHGIRGYLLQELVVHWEARIFESLRMSDSMWHFLYFFPLPHQQGSFRPNLGISFGAFSNPMSFAKNPILSP